jgi:hypothetical protein
MSDTLIVEIPLRAGPQRFSVQLAGKPYQMRLIYLDAPELGWVLDIADGEGVSLLAGMPLVTGCDLLGQYAYLGIAGQLRMASDVDPDATPSFDSLGQESHLYFKAWA